MEWFKKYWFWLAFGVLAAWWFFTGDTPIMLVTSFIGRGRRLGTHTQDSDGNNVESLDDLVAGAAAILGRDVNPDAYVLASVSASEHAHAGEKEKALIQRIVMNYAPGHGGIYQAVTGGKGMGTQPGRYCSTVNGPFEDDLRYAEANLAGTQPDDSHGSQHWVHKTGFKTLTDYQDTCARWFADMGVEPFDVGGVSSLRIFLKADLVAQLDPSQVAA